MTNKYDWDAIKAKIDLVELISHSVSLKRKGNLHEGLCPFHHEKNPSFKVYDDNYHCYGCGAHGDAIDFIVQMEGCTASEAIDRLGAGDFKLSGKEKQVIAEREIARYNEREKAIVEAYDKWESAKEAPEDHPYLERKEILPHMARLDGKALLLPVYDRNGDIQSVQTINSDGGKLFHPKAPMKGGRLNFGICIGRTIVCEGFATGASIYEAIPDRVAVGFSKHGVIELVRELHANGQEVAIASDRNALEEMLALGEELGIAVYAPPEPYDDFNDLAVDGDGPDAVRKILSSKPIKVEKDKPAPVDENPDPVDVWARNEAPLLPKGLLPNVLERAAYQAAALSGADPGGYAMAFLCATGAAIRDSIKLKVKRGEDWAEEARIWVMLLGEPSYKKSPIMKAATRSIASLDGQMVRDYERAVQAYKEDDSGDPPIPHRLRIDDVTMESAQEVAKHNPDGILAMQDELSGWFGGIEKYSGGKGSAKDRSFWLRAFGGGQYSVNRISRGAFLIDNLSISVLGGIQPDAIRKVVLDSTDDGLIQRFFPVVLRPAELEQDDLPSDAMKEYDHLIERLHTIEPPQNFFGTQPLTFDDEAQALRNELHVKFHGMVRTMESVNKKMSSHLGKYDGIFPRLCIIWHVIENANAEKLPPVVTIDTAKKVAKFLTEYIMRHAMAFYTTMIGASEDQDIIEDVAGYILAHKQTKVTLTTFQRGSTRMRKLTRKDVEPICHQLEAFGWITEIDARATQFICKVNPRVHEVFGARAEEEKKRREGIKAQIKGMVG